MITKQAEQISKEVSYEGATILIFKDQLNSSRTIKRYFVELISGSWPRDADLITLCDGTIPPEVNHFGGNVVNISERRKRVAVFTD